MLMTIPELPSLTSAVPFNNDNSAETESDSRSPEMAAQYYAKRVEEPPKPMMLPALAAAIAPGAMQDGRYRSPYASTEPARPAPLIAPIAPMAPMTAPQRNTPEPPRNIATLSAGDRTSSESQTDEHHEPPRPITIPGNNQYTPGVQRHSHPGTPVPQSSDGSKPARPRPHVCLTCQRTFARREHLNRHELSHTKEKPFECTECSRCFSRRDLLLRHKQKLHLTTPYVRPRDRPKMGEGSSDADGPGLAPVAPMSSGNDGANVSIAIHPSGRIQHSQDGMSHAGTQSGHEGERSAPHGMPMANMRPQLPIPRAPPPQPSSSGASLYYQKQDIDLSQLDLSRFRSLAHSPRPPPGPPLSALSAPRHLGAPRPAPLPMPINHDPEESGFHIPFAKRPRRDTDGRSRQSQVSRQAQSHSQMAPLAPMGVPIGQERQSYEPPHSLLNQLAIAAVPDQPRQQQQSYERNAISVADMGMTQAQPRVSEEVNIWRSPGGTHRVVQFDRSHNAPPQAPESLSVAATNQQARSPSQGRKRSLQEEDHDAEEGMKMQGGFRRSMRRALSMSMEDSAKVALVEELKNGKAKEDKAKGKKGEKVEKEKSNVKYVKAASSRSSLREKKAASPARGRKAKEAEKEKEPEIVTPEKRGRGRPPKSASAKGKKVAKPAESESPSEEEEEENDDAQAEIDKQLQLQEAKRAARGLRDTKKAKDAAGNEDTPGRTFRSVRLQAKYIGLGEGKK